jgi:hypothetical protein
MAASGLCRASVMDGFPVKEALWPAAADAAPAGLVARPPGWLAGDATVVLAPSPDWPPGLRERLATLLTGAGAAEEEASKASEWTEPVLPGLRRDGGILVVIGAGEALPAVAGVTVARQPAVRPARHRATGEGARSLGGAMRQGPERPAPSAQPGGLRLAESPARIVPTTPGPPCSKE